MALSSDMLAHRIKDAVRAAGVSQRQLAAAVGMDSTALSKALTGQRAFKSLEVALIAEHLGLSTDVLLADDGAEERERPALAARVQGGAGPVVLQAVGRAEQMRDLDILLVDLGRPAPPIVPTPALPPAAGPIRQGEVLADSVRRQTGMNDGDLPAEPDGFAAWVEEYLSIDVCITPLPNGLDGLALSSGQFRLALISSSIAATRQRFTLGHEICHLLSGDVQDLTVDEDVFGRHSAEERRANAFAAAFLMPAQAIRTAIENETLDETLIVSLLGRFRVSLDALAFRMHNVGVVDAASRDRIRAMSSARIALRPGRADDLQTRNERRAPGGLLIRAMDAFAAGDLGIRPLAALLDTDPDRLLDELCPPRFPRRPEDPQEPTYAL
jgi:Zn-dependent peptidase ImmA (M78 family)/transcriptional regulator with XRE-family HTH domain